ncbi:MAG TPA: hypothetical protein DCS07_02940 [Bdellovibrionales bacterium]|nr:MAG: hypothetical protein A2Z97_11150 [Bdellovibrionales bacterium GWB1_52_6]OFZ02540.1 MAG: hypothetical protein A2X97_07730 [Bdellovibrionales bacterium GWA1_52_35]OFZ35686.1 MAG: hypothetical protein A2070_15360 [Bdellovibrionales bacterium GWC1_52_8]HAR41579.1 hypothetical protein [Bdellovibrionales bacterium]HCM41389.1 hypothetical protein [Bdellovibrionales bacterium]
MVPIYDTDIAEERWSKSEWDHYELWEKLEHKIKLRQRLWILATLVLFFVLFSIPILSEQQPKRASLKAVNELAHQISGLKVAAALKHKAFRIRFSGDGTLRYQIEELPSCLAGVPEVAVTETKAIQASELSLLTPQQGDSLGLSDLAQEFCYDPLLGNSKESLSGAPVGFAIIPTQDLLEQRLDRISILQMKGSSAEISFD